MGSVWSFHRLDPSRWTQSSTQGRCSRTLSGQAEEGRRQQPRSSHTGYGGLAQPHPGPTGRKWSSTEQGGSMAWTCMWKGTSQPQPGWTVGRAHALSQNQSHMRTGRDLAPQEEGSMGRPHGGIKEGGMGQPQTSCTRGRGMAQSNPVTLREGDVAWPQSGHPREESWPGLELWQQGGVALLSLLLCHQIS